MTMKQWTSRILAVLLVLVLLFPLVSQRAEAAGTSLSGSSSLRPGNSVTLTFSVSGSGLYAVQASLSYDSSKLSLISADQIIGSSWTMDMNGSTIVLSDSKLSSPINSSTSLFSVTFQVKSSVSPGSTVSASVCGVTASDGSSDFSLSDASWSATIAAPLSSNAALSSLYCSNATLSPEFSSGTTSYSATVPYEVSSLSLSCSTDDDDADYSVSGNSLSVGENTVTITVIAEDGSARYYTIYVTREQDPNYVPGTDAALSELTCSEGRLSPAFSTDVTDYVIYLPYETTSITLSGVARDGKAKNVAGQTAELQVGDNILQVRCTAEDGTTVKDYTVHVWRMPQYAGVLPEIISPDVDAMQPVPGKKDSSGILAALCAAVTLPFIGRALPLYIPLAVAAALLLLLLFLFGVLIGKRSGKKRVLRELAEAQYEENAYLPLRFDENEESSAEEAAAETSEESETDAQEEPSIEENPASAEEIAPEESEPLPEMPDPALDDVMKSYDHVSLDELLDDIKQM